MTMADRLRREDGTSLVELVFAMAIFLVLLLAVHQLLDSATKTERMEQARHDALVDVRNAMERISKDVRQATSISASSTTTRLDMETLIAGSAHRVVFELVDDEVQRTIDDGTPVPLVSNVLAADLFCYDPPDCEATDPGSPTIVRVTLEAEPEVFASAPVTLITDVKLRNA